MIGMVLSRCFIGLALIVLITTCNVHCCNAQGDNSSLEDRVKSCNPYINYQKGLSNIVNNFLLRDKDAAADLLKPERREEFVQGCIAFSSRDKELKKQIPSDESLRGFDIITKLQETVDRTCNLSHSGTLSCADIVQVAVNAASLPRN